MATLVWIVGHSAVGKKTLLDRWETADAAELRRDLKLDGLFVKYSLAGDSVGEVERLTKFDIEKILTTLDSGKNVVVKWQACCRDMVNEICERDRTEHQHVVLHLHRPTQEHLQAFLEKYPESNKFNFDYQNDANKKYAESYRDVVTQYVDVEIIEGKYVII